MAKLIHEVRCGICGFIGFNNVERKLVNSQLCQRLRAGHGLAMVFGFCPSQPHVRVGPSGGYEFAPPPLRTMCRRGAVRGGHVVLLIRSEPQAAPRLNKPDYVGVRGTT